MTERHNVVIVGAGIVGCAVAYNLTALGECDVLLLEREPLPGTGSTSKANGGIRAQFTTPVNIAMSLAAMALLDELAPEIGDPPLYRKAGYLFLTGDAARLAAMAAAVVFQRERGVAAELLDAAGVLRRAPYVSGDRLLGGTFGARDGFIDPGGLANGFSGHGVMHSPATGRCIAELILTGRSTTVDIAPLALDRFARGAALHETMVL
jgi:sarcosine oxidase subunit beta